MTKADIPPGGEGEVQVTFSTAGKKGKQTKTVTITSNDPENPKTKVKVKALIEVEFDFALRGLNFGEVKLDEPFSKNVFVTVKDAANTQITKLESTSEFITAKQLETIPGDNGAAKIEIEITLLPGLVPGRITGTITAHSNLESKPKSNIRLSGSVIGDIKLIPETLRFDRFPIKGEKTSKFQKFQVVNLSEERELHILSVEDPDGRLDLVINTVEEGQKYEVEASLIEETLGDGNYYRGTIQITTDNPDQGTAVVSYNIYSRK